MKTNILKGKVVHGKALGRTVGMPTANLCVESGAIPKRGVYATRFYIGDRCFGSVTNIGTRPSVDAEDRVTVESYILHFDEDIYGEYVQVDIVEFLRPIFKFNSLQDVQEQVKKDVEKAKKCLDIEKSK